MRNTLKFELLINMRWEMLNNRTEFNLLEVVFVKHINGPTGSRIFVYYCFFIGFVLAAGLILLFNRTGYITVDMSFLLNLLLLVSLLFLIFRRRALGIFAVSVWAFHFVFLWLAPLIQTRLGSYPNTMYFDEKLVVQTNLLVFVFLSAFIIASLFGEREPIKRLISYHIENRISLRTFMVVFVLTLIILGLFFKKVFPYFHPNFGVLSTRNETQVYNLIVHKFLFNFPIFLALWILTDGFGVLGVILFGWILGRASAKIDSYLTSRGEYGFADSVIIYIAFHMIFMLRGDLMSSFAYLIGFLLAVWFLPQTIQCVLLLFR